MENIIHIHEVLNYLRQESKDLTRQELLSKINELFGENTTFTTCGDHRLNPEQAIDFMHQREKIIVLDGFIRINRDMESC